MQQDITRFKDYSTSDFALDDDFIRWVWRSPEDENDLFNQIKILYPEQVVNMDKAKKIVLALDVKILPVPDEVKDLIWKKVIADSGKGRVVQMQKRKYFWWAAACVVAIIASFVTYNIFTKDQRTVNSLAHKNSPVQNDIQPGGNKAILTLADGSTITLDSANNGTLSQQGNVTVIKMNDGKLAYDKGNSAGKIMYNTITTPRGGQYQLVLADGSKVWLNAESSLRFPVAFTGKERRVELTGEGYFEVAHDAAKPFYVGVGEMDVRVLGTHFNINAYSDENNVKATLLEGSVNVTEGGQSVMLHPGQQAKVSTGKIAVADNVNIESVVAWKEGLFYFDNDNIEKVMRQLSRWYNIDVAYEGKVPERLFSGQMKRSLTLSQVMQILEYNNIKYSIVGKKMIISE